MSITQSRPAKRPTLSLAKPPDKVPPVMAKVLQDKAAAAAAAAAEVAARKAANVAQEREIAAAAKLRREQANRDAFKRLQQAAPRLFNLTKPLPLAIGISNDVRAVLGATVKANSRLMHWWTRRLAYQRAVAAGGPRYGLDGSQQGEVTSDQQAFAQETVARLLAAKRTSGNGE